MRSQFQQREALTEQTVVDRKVLADGNIIRIKKETRQKIKGTESEWQGRASKWLATARRKVNLQPCQVVLHNYLIHTVYITTESSIAIDSDDKCWINQGATRGVWPCIQGPRLFET